MANKKFYVDIDLQNNKLDNAVIGTSAMTLEGSFRYNSNRLEYVDSIGVKQVANLDDVLGLLDFKGEYDATNNIPNLTSPTAGAVKKGDFYVVTVGGTFFTEEVSVGDTLIANDNDPVSLGDWTVVQGNLNVATTTTPGIVTLADSAAIAAGTPGAYAVVASDFKNELDLLLYADGRNPVTDTIDFDGNSITAANDIDVTTLSNSNTGIVQVSAQLDLSTNSIQNVNEIAVSGILSNGGPILIGATLDLQFANTIQNGTIDTVDISNATLTTALDAGNFQINNVSDPTLDQDAANKKYVDDQLADNTFTDDYVSGSWSSGVLTVAHGLGTVAPKVVAYVSSELVEFAIAVVDGDTITLTTNIAAPASVKVGVTV